MLHDPLDDLVACWMELLDKRRACDKSVLDNGKQDLAEYGSVCCLNNSPDARRAKT